MKKLTVFVAGVLLATPALAQSSQAPTGGTAVPVEKPQMCEMMHNGMKMQGMMVKGEDGKIYVPGFGWITDNGGGGQGTTVDGDGDINKQVGNMGE